MKKIYITPIADIVMVDGNADIMDDVVIQVSRWSGEGENAKENVINSLQIYDDNSSKAPNSKKYNSEIWD